MNRRTLLVIVAVLVLAALTFAQTPCPEQEYKTWADQAVVIDPNMIAIDPASGQRLFLDAITTEIGRQWAYAGYACDPDGDPIVVTTSYGELEVANGVYTLRGIETAIGVRYINITAEDMPGEHQTPIVRTGTLVVVATPRNQGPVLCGGRP